MSVDSTMVDATAYRRVRLWLSSTFEEHGLEVPPFEVTPRTVGALDGVRSRSKACDADAAVLARSLDVVTAEYTAEADRLEALLAPVGLLPRDLSASGRTSLQVLASCAVYLGVSEPVSSMLCMALADASRELHVVALRQAELEREVAELERQLQEASAYRLQVKRERQQLVDEAAEHEAGDEGVATMRASVAKLAAKRDAYRAEAARYRAARDKAVGGDSRLLHESLSKQGRAIDELWAANEDVQRKLQAFADLPPDKAAAEDKLRAAQDEVARLTEAFSEAAAAQDPFGRR